MRTEIVRTWDRFQTIGPAWERLWRSGAHAIFQSHAWIAAWWTGRTAESGFRLHIGLCWDGDDLVAAIPCVTRRHRLLRVLEWAAKDCSDYCDALATSPPALADTWQAMVRAGGFQIVYLSHVRPGATLSLLPQAGAPRAAGLRTGHRSERSLQVRSNGLSGAGWFRTLPKKARNNHTRGKRILQETGPLRIGAVDEAGRDDALARMIALKRQWLRATGQRNALLDDEARGLIALVDCLRRQRALQLFGLFCGADLVAGLVNIVGDGQAAAFFSAFDPRYERASPGTIVIVEHLLWAFDHGVPQVDFLCGDEHYKTRFANARTELASYVGAPTALGRAALAAAEAIAGGRTRSHADARHALAAT